MHNRLRQSSTYLATGSGKSRQLVTWGMNSNTTSEQDRQIERAAGIANTVDDLLAIIRDLDDQLDEWSEKTGYGTADDAKAELESRAAGIDCLKQELEEARGTVEDLEIQRNSLERERDAADADARDSRQQLEVACRRIEALETQIVEATT